MFSMTWPNSKSVVLTLAMAVGGMAIVWAVFSPSGACISSSADSGTCSSYMQVKEVIGGTGLLVLTVATLLRFRFTVTPRR